MPRLSTSSTVSSDCQDKIDVGREFLQLYELTGYMSTCQASCSSHHLRGAHLISALLVLVWEYLKQQTLLYDKKISTKATAAHKFREIQKGMLSKKTSWCSAESPFSCQQWCSLFLYRASSGVANRIPSLQLFLSSFLLQTSSYSSPASTSKLSSLESICLMN